MTAHASFEEDAWPGSDLTLYIGQGADGSISISTEGDQELAPVYFTPDRARAIAAALVEVARISEGLPSHGLFDVEEAQ